MLAVHFGAGSIGRGFIGQLLRSTGYDIVFVDINRALIDSLNQSGGYDLYVVEEEYRNIRVDRIKGVYLDVDSAELRSALLAADLVTTSVRVENLPGVAKVLAPALQARVEKGCPRLNVIPCENALANGNLLRQATHAAGISQTDLAAAATFPSTSVDRLVLPSNHGGVAPIDIGRDFELVIDATALSAPDERPITGAIYTDSLEKYIERKLFIINGGHVWAGYVGSQEGYTVIQDVFADRSLEAGTRAMMGEACKLLSAKWEFPMSELQAYVDFAVRRFRTPGITDAITRVCRSPIRKLGREERLVSPALQCLDLGLPHRNYVQGIAAAYRYLDPSDEESAQLANIVSNEGISAALERVSSLVPHEPLYQEIITNFQSRGTDGRAGSA